MLAITLRRRRFFFFFFFFFSPAAAPASPPAPAAPAAPGPAFFLTFFFLPAAAAMAARASGGMWPSKKAEGEAMTGRVRRKAAVRPAEVAGASASDADAEAVLRPEAYKGMLLQCGVDTGSKAGDRSKRACRSLNRYSGAVHTRPTESTCPHWHTRTHESVTPPSSSSSSSPSSSSSSASSLPALPPPAVAWLRMLLRRMAVAATRLLPRLPGAPPELLPALEDGRMGTGS
mgnify:CR=1 FL=1